MNPFTVALNQAIKAYKDNPDARQRKELEYRYAALANEEKMARLNAYLNNLYRKQQSKGSGFGGFLGSTLGSIAGNILLPGFGAVIGHKLGGGLGRIGEGRFSGNDAGEGAFMHGMAGQGGQPWLFQQIPEKDPKTGKETGRYDYKYWWD